MVRGCLVHRQREERHQFTRTRPGLGRHSEDGLVHVASHPSGNAGRYVSQAVRSDTELPQVKVGDFVQWTSGGGEQFPSPRKVVGFSDDHEWAFVEGSQTGVSVSELSVIDPLPAEGDTAPPRTAPRNPFAPKTGDAVDEKVGFSIERATFEEGPVVVQLPAKMTKDSIEEFEYWITGVVRRA